MCAGDQERANVCWEVVEEMQSRKRAERQKVEERVGDSNKRKQERASETAQGSDSKRSRPN